MQTKVRNLLKKKSEMLFVNEYLPIENIVNYIIIKNNQTSQILNQEHRQKIKEKYKIVEKVSINGDNIAFCYELDLFARQYKNL